MPKQIGNYRVGRDAELRILQDGTPVANISLAYDYGKAGQDGKRATQWIDATMWGKRAETLASYLLRGSMHCFTLDEMHIQMFTRHDGTQGHKLVARVLDVELGSRPEGQTGARTSAPRQAAAPAPRPTPAPAPRAASGFDEMDDDIPFIDPMRLSLGLWLAC